LSPSLRAMSTNLDADARATRVYLLVRVWIPDRPGALGLVAARIGAVHGDIVGIDVLEQSGGIAVDEFAVVLPNADLVPLLVRELEQVDGTSVEEVRTVHDFPDPRLDALESAAEITAATDVRSLIARTTAHLGAEFAADWSAMVIDGEVRHAVGEAPAADALVALAAGLAASPLVSSGEAGPDDLAVAMLVDHDATLLLGREGRPFRRRERAQLLGLARIADRTWTLLQE
jgi:hypothetical protein